MVKGSQGRRKSNRSTEGRMDTSDNTTGNTTDNASKTTDKEKEVQKAINETNRTVDSSMHSRHSSSSVPPSRRRKFSEISSPDITPSVNEERLVSIIADALKPLQEKLDEILETQAQRGTELGHCHEKLKELNSFNGEQQRQIEELQRENVSLKNRILSQETYSRRSNLKFYGIEENKYEDPENIVLLFLEENGIRLHPRSIERAHRLGAYVTGNTRPIIVRFLHYKDRDHVWRTLGHGLIPPKFTKPHVREDFPPEVDEARAILLSIAKAATKEKDCATGKPYKIRLLVDKLYINNQKYTTDTLSMLPKHLQPTSIFTPRNDDKTAFFTRQSPLSSHYPSPFKVNGEVYNCMEQYLVSAKARTFGDQVTVNKVNQEIIPSKQRRLGKTIMGYDEQTWQRVAEEKLLPGLMAKFQQNDDYKLMLLDTKDSLLIEANPGDLFFGAGVSLYSLDLWNTSKHPGKNIMGKLLQRVRSSIQND